MLIFFASSVIICLFSIFKRRYGILPIYLYVSIFPTAPMYPRRYSDGGTLHRACPRGTVRPRAKRYTPSDERSYSVCRRGMRCLGYDLYANSIKTRTMSAFFFFSFRPLRTVPDRRTILPGSRHASDQSRPPTPVPRGAADTMRNKYCARRTACEACP